MKNVSKTKKSHFKKWKELKRVFVPEPVTLLVLSTHEILKDAFHLILYDGLCNII